MKYTSGGVALKMHEKKGATEGEGWRIRTKKHQLFPGEVDI